MQALQPVAHQNGTKWPATQKRYQQGLPLAFHTTRPGWAASLGLCRNNGTYNATHTHFPERIVTHLQEHLPETGTYTMKFGRYYVIGPFTQRRLVEWAGLGFEKSSIICYWGKDESVRCWTADEDGGQEEAPPGTSLTILIGQGCIAWVRIT